MASTTSTLTPLSLSLSSSSKAPLRLQPPTQCVTLPTSPLPPPSTANSKTTPAYTCRKTGRNVAVMATSTTSTSTGEASAEVVTTTETETPEIVTKVQQAWDKLEDKYAVTSLAVAGLVGLVACAGVISAIDKLPLIPGVLELVGIGYTGYFAYKNLVSKPNREALIEKIKCTYSDVIGSS